MPLVWDLLSRIGVCTVVGTVLATSLFDRLRRASHGPAFGGHLLEFCLTPNSSSSNVRAVSAQMPETQGFAVCIRYAWRPTTENGYTTDSVTLVTFCDIGHHSAAA